VIPASRNNANPAWAETPVLTTSSASSTRRPVSRGRMRGSSHMRRPVLAPPAGEVIELSGTDSRSSYQRLRVTDGATQFGWPKARARPEPTKWPSVGRPTTMSGRKAEAAGASHAQSWSSTAKEA